MVHSPSAAITVCSVLLLTSTFTLNACASSGLDEGDQNVRFEADGGPPSMMEKRDSGGDSSNRADAGGGADQGGAPSFDVGPDSAEPALDGGSLPDLPPQTDPCAGDDSTADWRPLGSVLNALPGASDASSPSIAVDGRCRPVVAFHEEDGTNAPNVFVYRWDKSSGWEPLGGAIDATAQDDRWTTGVQVATHGEVPYIAWAEITQAGPVGVFVARWDGTQWEQLGDISVGRLLSFTLGLTVDSQGRPAVAWNADDGLNTKTRVHVARYENGVWGPLGGPLEADAGNQNALAPDLIHDAQDRLIVAWQESDAIHARRWETSWVDFLGAPIVPSSAPRAFDANLALAPNDDIAFGWREAARSTNASVRRWDGAMFSTIADSMDVEEETSGRTNTNNLTLAVDSLDRVVFAFDEPRPAGPLRVHVYRHDGALAPLGAGIVDANSGDTDGFAPDLAVDQRDRVVVAWVEEGAAAREIHVARYTD